MKTPLWRKLEVALCKLAQDYGTLGESYVSDDKIIQIALPEVNLTKLAQDLAKEIEG